MYELFLENLQKCQEVAVLDSGLWRLDRRFLTWRGDPNMKAMDKLGACLWNSSCSMRPLCSFDGRTLRRKIA
jgi:hypothetical protein